MRHTTETGHFAGYRILGARTRSAEASMTDREPKDHELKCWPAVFQAILDGIKLFEFRKNDRDFRVRDTLTQREWDPEKRGYTGRVMHQGPIPYIVYGGRFGIPEGYCIMQTDVPEVTRLRAALSESERKLGERIRDLQENSKKSGERVIHYEKLWNESEASRAMMRVAIQAHCRECHGFETDRESSVDDCARCHLRVTPTPSDWLAREMGPLVEAAERLRDIVRASNAVPSPKDNSMGWDIWNECLAEIKKAKALSASKGAL